MLQHCLLLCGFWWESSDIENVVLCLQHVLYLCPASFKIPFLSLVFSSLTLMCLFVYFQFQLEFLKFLEPEDICLSQKPGSSSHYSFEYFCCLTLSLSSPSGTPRIYILKGFFLISSPWVSAHFESFFPLCPSDLLISIYLSSTISIFLLSKWFFFLISYPASLRLYILSFCFSACVPVFFLSKEYSLLPDGL